MTQYSIRPNRSAISAQTVYYSVEYLFLLP